METQDVGAQNFLGRQPDRHDRGDDDGETGRRRAPIDPWNAFAYFVGKCAEGFARELIEQGKTVIQARNAVIGCFLDMAAGEACRVARGEGREPDRSKWDKAVNDAFERAVKRTAAKDHG